MQNSRIPSSPLSRASIDALATPAGNADVDLCFGELRLRLRSLPEDLLGRMRERYGPYVHEVDPVSDPALTIDAFREERPYFIEPPERSETNPVIIKCVESCVRFQSYVVAGWFDTESGLGRLAISTGDYDLPERGVENYLRCAVAWVAITRGGALVHAASSVRDGRGYLFYGESGAGKSTLSKSNRRGQVVSDDLSLLLDKPGEGLHLVGTPFRGTYEDGAPVLGMFPVAAGFRLIQDTDVKVESVARIVALAELVGNLPFVADSFPQRGDLFARVETTFAGVPLRRLHFRPDDSFWDAIDRVDL